jgi:hypothetical protein
MALLFVVLFGSFASATETRGANHTISIRDDVAREKQIGRLRDLVRSLELVAPSGICDSVVARGVGVAACTGTADGPIGQVPVRMNIAARLDSIADGSLTLVVFNATALEAKGLFSWTTLVRPEELMLVVHFVPEGDHWRACSRMNVTMASHPDAAPRLLDKIALLDNWISRDLATR